MAVAALVIVVFLLSGGGDGGRAGDAVSHASPPGGGAPPPPPTGAPAAPLHPGTLKGYVYQSPPESAETRREMERLVGAETALRLLVPRTAEMGMDILTLIVARYPPDSPQHAENLRNLLENPAAPPETRKVAGTSTSFIPGQAASPTQPARPPALLWRKDARVDVFLTGGTEKQLLAAMAELVRGGG